MFHLRTNIHLCIIFFDRSQLLHMYMNNITSLSIFLKLILRNVYMFTPLATLISNINEHKVLDWYVAVCGSRKTLFEMDIFFLRFFSSRSAKGGKKYWPKIILVFLLRGLGLCTKFFKQWKLLRYRYILQLNTYRRNAQPSSSLQHKFLSQWQAPNLASFPEQRREGKTHCSLEAVTRPSSWFPKK